MLQSEMDRLYLRMETRCRYQMKWQNFRDPKIWKEEDGYYMVVGNKTDDGKPHVVLFHSEDAISWEYVSVLAKDDTGMLGTMWEHADSMV